MTAERDPDLQREIDRAVTWWARYLSGRLLPGIDPEHVARHGVEAMCAERWRVIPKPPDWRAQRDQRPADPSQNEAWKDAKAKITGKDPA